MAKYKIPHHPVFRDFAIVKTINGTFICPGWIPVDADTTRDDVEFTETVNIVKNEDVLETPKIDQLKEFKVPSSNGKSEYLVKFQHGVWSCTCPASTFRRGNCKHIKEIETKENAYI